MSLSLTLALLAALLIAVVLVATLVRWRRRRLAAVSIVLPGAEGARRAPTARIVRKLPVVLVHGLMGFDELRLPGGRVHYFRGVARRLRELGVDVHVTRVPPVRSIRARAGVLAPQLAGLRIRSASSSPIAWAASTRATRSRAWAWRRGSPSW